MRIVLDITSAVKPDPTGIGNYVVDLVTAMLDEDRGNHFTLGIRAKRFPRRRFVESLGRGRAPILPLVPPLYSLILGRIDLLHALGVRLPRLGKFRKVVTIHDLNTIETPGFSSAEWAKNRGERIAETIARADGIVTPSEFTRQRILARFSFPPERIRAVLHGVDHDLYRPKPPEEIEAVRKKHGLEKPYVLHIGAYVPRKNKKLLVQAFAQSRARKDGLLALAGSKRGNFAEIAAEAERLGLGDSIRYLGFVERDEIAALLGGARLFAFPSAYEGFGLPVIEAMAVGVATLAAGVSSLPEVGGDAVQYFDPSSAEELASRIDRLWEDREARSTLARLGRERAALFTWKRAAEQTLQFYREVAR